MKQFVHNARRDGMAVDAVGCLEMLIVVHGFNPTAESTSMISTNCTQVTLYGDIYLDHHWLRLLVWRHKTITWTNVYFSLVKFCGIHLRAIS